MSSEIQKTDGATESGAELDSDRIQAALDAGNSFSFEWDVRSHRVQRSESSASVLGLALATAVAGTGSAHFQRIEPEDLPMVDQTLAGLTPDAPDFEMAYRYRRGREDAIWLDVSGRGEFDRAGSLIRVRGVAREATALMQAHQRDIEQAAAATAAQAAVDTVNAMGEGVALLSLEGDIRTFNPAFAALAELSRDELVGQNIRQVLPDMFDEEEAVVERTLARVALRRAMDDRGDALCITTGCGAAKWVVPTLSTIQGETHQPVGIVLTLRDISSLIHAQMRTAESEQRYRELVESVNSIIVRIAPDRGITYFNQFARSFLGYRADEILGRDVIGTIFPEQDTQGQDLRPRLEEVLAHPELHGTLDLETCCRDGRRVWVHWSNRGIRDDQGGIREVLCVGADIGQRKALEQQAREYRRRMRERSDRLAATEEQERRRLSTHLHDTVIQNLSLGNIRLGGIRGALGPDGPPAILGKIDQVRNLVEEGIAECRRLMADLTPPLLYELGLGPALLDFAERQQRLHGVRIAVAEDDHPKPMDDARRGLVFQAARELVMNALKHAGPCEIAIRLFREGDTVCLDVQDTGKGFDPAQVELFAPDEEGGFGLFNIRERLRGLNGQLDLASGPGQGTRAALRIPIDPA